MDDDLGREVLKWSADRWKALDDIAKRALGEFAVFRTLLDQKEENATVSTRIGLVNVPFKNIGYEFKLDLWNARDEDTDRDVNIAAQALAVIEDEYALTAMIEAGDLDDLQQSGELTYVEFIKAKDTLRSRGVQYGLGAFVSSLGLADLVTKVFGAQTGLEVTERVLPVKILQSNALPHPQYAQVDRGDGSDTDAHHIDAVLLQAAPPAYRMVRAWGPRLRVLEVKGGSSVRFQLEEGIAVGALQKRRCLGIERRPELSRADRAEPPVTQRMAAQLTEAAHTPPPQVQAGREESERVPTTSQKPVAQTTGTPTSPAQVTGAEKSPRTRLTARPPGSE